MNRKQFLLALAAAAATTLAIVLVFGLEHEVPLDPLEAAPRPPVRAPPDTLPLTLAGRLDPRPEKGNELRRRRNEVAQKHREALARWRAGLVPLRDVEALEMDLWVLRHAVGEIEAPTMHAKLAELFERERQRLAKLHAAGLAGADQLARAALFVARQRHLAGLPVGDPQGRDYEQLRTAYLTSVRERHQRLIDQGVGHREHLKQEYQALEREFAPLGDAP